MSLKWKHNNYILPFLVFFILVFLFASGLYAGSITLSWNPPTTNEDGSPLTDLAGYKIYYGTSSRNYSFYINVGNVNSYTVNNLTEGATYYFAVTAYDNSGNESKFSNEVSKIIEQNLTQLYSLNVMRAGNGSGTIISTPAGINCGYDCTESYSAGSLITLSATADSNSIFVGWSGGKCIGNSTQCILTLNEPTTITANFESVMQCAISGNVSSNKGSMSDVTVLLSGSGFDNISTLTDGNGNYCFSGLSRGVYSIRVSENGYIFNPSIRHVKYINSEVSGQHFVGTPIVTSYNSYNYSISGRIIQSNGNPKEGVTVILKGAIEDVTITDSYGNYSFIGLPQGNYIITPVLSEYKFRPSHRRVTIKGFALSNQNFLCIGSGSFRSNPK